MSEELPKKEAKFEEVKNTFKAIKQFFFISRRTLFSLHAKYDFKNHQYYFRSATSDSYRKIQYVLWNHFLQVIDSYLAILNEDEEFEFEEDLY